MTCQDHTAREWQSQGSTIGLCDGRTHPATIGRLKVGLEWAGGRWETAGLGNSRELRALSQTTGAVCPLSSSVVLSMLVSLPHLSMRGLIVIVVTTNFILCVKHYCSNI